MYKAPEQLTGPPPALLPCDPEEPCPLGERLWHGH